MACRPLRRRCARRSDQQGRSLVELMISLTLSALLVAGVASAFLGSAHTARVSRQISSMGNDGHLVLQMLGHSIRQAGYAELVGAEIGLGDGAGTSTRANSLFGDGVAIFGCAGAGFVDDTADTPTCAGSGHPDYDALMVRYQSGLVIPPADFVVDDCLGVAPPPQPLPADHPGRMRVQGGDRPIVQNAYFGRDGSLWCRGNGRTAAADPFRPAQELAANVEQFKVFYGFDDTRWANPTAGGSPSVRTLRDARFLQGLPAASRPWDYVVSVHLCMVVRSDPEGPGAATAAAVQSYARCPRDDAEAVSGPVTVTARDGAMRRTFTQVFTVRSAAAPNPLEFMP